MTMLRSSARSTTMRHMAGTIACLLLLTAGCRRSPRANTDAVLPVALPAPPENLLATLVVAHPHRTWQEVRAAFGGSGMPRDLSLGAAAVLDLPPSACELLDTSSPIVGAMIQTEHRAEAVLAARVKDAAQLLARATAPGAGFRRAAPIGDLVELVREPPARWALAVHGNHLVVASNLDAVRAAIPFVTGNVAAQKPPAEDLVVTAPHAALSGRLRTMLERGWAAWRDRREAQDLAMRQAHGGSAPDFGDPAEALADIDARAKHVFDLMSDIGEASARVTLGRVADTPNVHIALVTNAASPAGPFAREFAALTFGDGEELLALPSTTAAGLLVYDNRAAREESARQKLTSLARVFGGRLGAEDREKIETALLGWAEGRADWLAVGMLADNGARRAFWRGGVADPEATHRALLAFLRLVEVPAFAEPIKVWVGEMKLSASGKAVPTGGVHTVHVVRRPPKLRRSAGSPPTTASAFDIVWSIADDTVTGAIGDDARAAHDALQSRGGNTLRTEARLLAALARRGRGTSLAAFVDLRRIGLQQSEGTTIVVTYGKARPDARDETSVTIDLPLEVAIGYASTMPSLLHP